MTVNEILKICRTNLNDVVLVDSWGEKGIFYNPQNTLKRGVYVLTIKEKDGENDKASHLDRQNIYRINIGIRKETFQRMFGEIPKRPAKGGIVAMDYDFTKIDTIMPHPIYAWMGWINILNPSEQTFEKIKPLIQEAYEFSQEKFCKKKKEISNRKNK